MSFAAPASVVLTLCLTGGSVFAVDQQQPSGPSPRTVSSAAPQPSVLDGLSGAVGLQRRAQCGRGHGPAGAGAAQRGSSSGCAAGEHTGRSASGDGRRCARDERRRDKRRWHERGRQGGGGDGAAWVPVLTKRVARWRSSWRPNAERCCATSSKCRRSSPFAPPRRLVSITDDLKRERSLRHRRQEAEVSAQRRDLRSVRRLAGLRVPQGDPRIEQLQDDRDVRPQRGWKAALRDYPDRRSQAARDDGRCQPRVRPHLVGAVVLNE